VTPEERVAAMPVYYLRIDLKEPRVIDVPDLARNSAEIVKAIRAGVAEERELCEEAVRAVKNESFPLTHPWNVALDLALAAIRLASGADCIW